MAGSEAPMTGNGLVNDTPELIERFTAEDRCSSPACEHCPFRQDHNELLVLEEPSGMRCCLVFKEGEVNFVGHCYRHVVNH